MWQTIQGRPRHGRIRLDRRLATTLGRARATGPVQRRQRQAVIELRAPQAARAAALGDDGVPSAGLLARTLRPPDAGHVPSGVRAPVRYGPASPPRGVPAERALPARRPSGRGLSRPVQGCTATLSGMTRQMAERWRDCSERVRDRIVSVDSMRHPDGTGFRIGGRTQWLHVVSTRWLMFYHPSARRGSLPEGLQGCLVHDH